MRLDPGYWGSGLATEGGRAALEAGFGLLGLDEIVSIYEPENAASGRVMEHLGMALDRDTTRPTLGVPLRVYRICRGTWEAGVTIRSSRPEDSPLLRDIERRARARFRDVGLDHVADDEPLSIDELTRYAAAGRGWVAVGHDGDVVGYVVVDVVDGNAHVEQVSVRPDHQGRGVGRALQEQVRGWPPASARLRSRSRRSATS